MEGPPATFRSARSPLVLARNFSSLDAGEDAPVKIMMSQLKDSLPETDRVCPQLYTVIYIVLYPTSDGIVRPIIVRRTCLQIKRFQHRHEKISSRASYGSLFSHNMRSFSAAHEATASTPCLNYYSPSSDQSRWYVILRRQPPSRTSRIGG